jgi:beta-mannosidase
MSAVLSPEHWGLQGGAPPDTCGEPTQCLGEHNCNGTNPMTQRNYGCDGQIRLYWGNHTTVALNATGEAAFKGQLYQCQMVQAFVLKQVYESRRADNQFGHLVWMLNEIWPTVR